MIYGEKKQKFLDEEAWVLCGYHRSEWRERDDKQGRGRQGQTNELCAHKDSGSGEYGEGGCKQAECPFLEDNTVPSEDFMMQWM